MLTTITIMSLVTAAIVGLIALLVLEMRRTNVANRKWFDRIQELECMYADHRAMVDEIVRENKKRRKEQMSVLTSQDVSAAKPVDHHPV